MPRTCITPARPTAAHSTGGPGGVERGGARAGSTVPPYPKPAASWAGWRWSTRHHLRVGLDEVQERGGDVGVGRLRRDAQGVARGHSVGPAAGGVGWEEEEPELAGSGLVQSGCLPVAAREEHTIALDEPGRRLRLVD